MCEAILDASRNQAPAASDPPTIGEIFRRYGPAYRAKYAPRMSRDQLQAMDLIERCRTGELGSIRYHCEDCGLRHYRPRSCGNRHCPLCQGHKAKQWLQRQVDQLLPCVYFFATFTLPKQLRPFVRSHPRECYRALFDAAAATLFQLARNPRHVGSSGLGFTGVLHTWGRTLSYHPHLHIIVPGGAISQDGQSWLPSRVDFFLPVHAASRLFRAEFQARIAKLGLLGRIPKLVWHQRWVVHCQPVGDGRRALRYLAPYVFRVAISNRRVVRVEPAAGADQLGALRDRVTFTYRPSGSRRYRQMRVTAEEFLRRFLQHVLPRGFQKVRHYGFAHPRRKIDREWLAMLVTVTLNRIYVLTVRAKPLAVKVFPSCPACGGPLRCVGFLPADNGFPLVAAGCAESRPHRPFDTS